MKNLYLLFFGILGCMALPFAGVILSSHLQLGHLEPAAIEEGEPLYPRAPLGLAEEGKRVYTEMGCAYCHTQQVGRPEYRSDIARGWGARQTVARDYIRQDRVLLGNRRIGPDLANFGDRVRRSIEPSEDAQASAEALKIAEQAVHQHLYAPQSVTPSSTMPPHPFLYEIHKIEAGKGSSKALNLPPQYALPEGYEVRPTSSAEALVAYLLSLTLDYPLPEAPFIEEASDSEPTVTPATTDQQSVNDH